MNDTINVIEHADFGMPVISRVRVASLRAFPIAAVVPAAQDKCAFDDRTDVWGYGSVDTDVTVLTGAFPGTSAWSPPI